MNTQRKKLDEISIEINVILLSIEVPCYVVHNFPTIDIRTPKDIQSNKPSAERIIGIDISVYFGHFASHTHNRTPYCTIRINKKGEVSYYEESLASLRKLLKK